MYKKLLITALFLFVVPVALFAAPVSTYQVNILPFLNQTYDLGSTSPALEWKNIYTKNLIVSGTCTGCGSSSGFPFTPTTNYGALTNATNTPIWFQSGLQASSTSQIAYASTTNVSFTNNAGTTISDISVSSAGAMTFRVGGLSINWNGISLSPNSTNVRGLGTGSTQWAWFNTLYATSTYASSTALTATNLAFGNATSTGSLSVGASTTIVGQLNATLSAVISSTTLTGPTLLTNATTTTFAIAGISGSLLKTLTSGAVVPAIAGTDYANFAWPFTPVVDGNSTSTTIIFGNGILSTASSTFSGNATTTGMHTVGSLYINSERFTDLTGTGLTLSGTTLTNSGVISLGNGTGVTCTGTNPGSCSLAAIAANSVLVNNTSASAIPSALATSTFGTFLYGVGTPGQVLMWSGSTPVWAATSSTASAGGSGTVSTSTNEIAGNLPYWTSTSGTPALLGQVATGTISGSNGITTTAARYAVGGSLTIDCTVSSGTAAGCLSAANFVTFNANRLATSAILTQGQVLVSGAGGNTAYSIATSTPTISAPLAYSGTLGAFVGGSTGAFSITQSGTGANGYLSSTDFNTFNNKISSTSLSGATVISYTSSTGVITTTGGTFGAGNYSFPTDLVVTGNATSTYFFATTASTTNFSGAGLNTCQGGNFVTYNGAGKFGCAAAGGGSFPFTPTTNYAALTNATSTPLWFQAGLQASSTSHFNDVDFRNATSTGIVYLANGSAAAPSLTFAGETGNNTGFYLSGANNDISIAVAGSQMFRFDATGLMVGGTGAPAYALDLYRNGSGIQSVAGFSNTQAAAVGVGMEVDFNATSVRQGTFITAWEQANTQASYFSFGTRTAGALTQKWRFDSLGNLINEAGNNAGKIGVGSTTPLAKLAVHANNGETNRLLFEIASSTATATSSLLSLTNTGVFSILQTSNLGTTTGVYTVEAYANNLPQLSLSAGAGLTKWVFANEGGNLYLGTTTVAGTATSTPSALAIMNSGKGLFIGTSSNAAATGIAVVGTIYSTGLTVSTAGNSLCQLANGEVVNAGGTTCVTSSARFKHDIAHLTDGLKKVMALTPRSFTRNVPSPSQPSGKEIGFIAEEVALVAPLLVEYEPDGVTPRGVNYAESTAYLTLAIQEQQGQIAKLQWQWIGMLLLALVALYQQIQIRRLKR